MDFFEKMGETISGKSKEAAKKAKDLAEITKLSGQICRKKELITKEYEEIGREYYEANKDKADGLYATQCMVIKEAGENIQKLQKEIDKIKGIKKCESCGEDVCREARFCPKCGAATGKETEEKTEFSAETSTEGNPAEKSVENPAEKSGEIVATQKCPLCGADIQMDTVFCSSCGQKIL